MEKWSKIISKHLLKENGITQTVEEEIVEFGIAQGMSLICNLLIFLMIGVLFRNLLQGIFFLMAFWPLRIYAGGYHADTRKRCCFLSMCIAILIFILLKHVHFSRNVLLLLAMTMSCVVIRMAPVESKNRFFDKKEIDVFRMRIRWIQIVEMCVFLMSYCVADTYISNVIIWAQCLVVLLLVIGYWKNRTQNCT